MYRYLQGTSGTVIGVDISVVVVVGLGVVGGGMVVV